MVTLARPTLKACRRIGGLVSRSTVSVAGALVMLPSVLVTTQSKVVPEAERGTLVRVSVALVAPARLAPPERHWKAGGWKFPTVRGKLAVLCSMTVALVGWATIAGSRARYIRVAGMGDSMVPRSEEHTSEL